VISVVILLCSSLVLIEIIVLYIINKKNRELHTCIKAASNIARDMQLEVMLRNPYSPQAATQREPDLRNFICLKQINSQTKKQFVFSLNDPICIGRAKNKNQLILNDDLVSEYHCVIYLQKDGIYIRDLNSANGTVVSTRGSKKYMIANGASMLLQNGYKINIGTMKYVIKVFELNEF
jgi:pSer/pThr/pTyr-binding forkhead associated (FHA) protein